MRIALAVPGVLAVPCALVVALVVAARSQEAAPKNYQDGAPPSYQDGAKREQHEQMLADKHGTYGPADGGGSARVVEGGEAVAGTSSRYLLEYTAGELGIAVGGTLFFQVSPFWFWSSPQSEEPEAPGFTCVTINAGDAQGVALAVETIGPQCMQVKIGGAPLRAGAKVAFDYGCGAAGARVDRFAESEEAFYFWVDGDGDGTRKLIGADPHVKIAPGPAVDLVVMAPSEAAVGADFEVSIAFLDAVANAARGFAGVVELAGEGLELPPRLEFKADEPSHRRVRAKALAAGIHFVVARVGDSERARASNPILVSETPRRVLWADLHGHSQLSDGTATPEEFYEYARDVAALDVAVLTDHDHWGMRKLDQEPALWKRIHDVTARMNEPGRFTTLLGYEWTSWLYGHRHVLYFDGEGDVLSSLDAPTDTPQGLWQTLKERKAKALTVPHHPAGGPVPIDWSIPPDPDFEPVVEISSVHGTSEEPRGPRVIYSAMAGHFARDALARGYRLGFVGSGDTHDGHPGLGHLAQPCGGLAAILAADNSRDAILAALKARTCYATTGPRIVVWFKLGSARMGAIVPPPTPAERASDHAPSYFGLVIGDAPIARLELIKNGAPVAAAAPDGSIQQSLDWRDPDRHSGDSVYLRAIQSDGHAAWSSPIFTE